MATPVPFNTGLTPDQIQTAFSNALKFDELLEKINALESRVQALENSQSTEEAQE